MDPDAALLANGGPVGSLKVASQVSEHIVNILRRDGLEQRLDGSLVSELG